MWNQQFFDKQSAALSRQMRNRLEERGTMSETPEGKVKRMVKAWLKTMSRQFHFMPVSAGYGVHGIPDFVCCINGVFVGVETKANGKMPTELQHQRLKEICNAGGIAAVVRRKMDLQALEGLIKNWEPGCGVYLDFDRTE